jgi:hypothetical protein
LYAVGPDRFEDDLVEQQFVAHRESGLTAAQRNICKNNL